jgi:methionyl-tRNA synthetase
MKAVLTNLFQQLRTLAIGIQPVIPAKASALLDQLGIPTDERSYAAIDDASWFNRLLASGYTVAPPTPLFPRLELPAEAESA